MRPKFFEYVNKEMGNVLPLFPEHALAHHIGRDGFKFTDLSNFEKLIGDACFCIVMFPEAPGSFAELGMFSVLDELNKKTLACLDLKYQADDSFISTGPIAILDSVSSFKPALQMPYENPNFDLIKGRIESRKTVKWKNKYKIPSKPWSELGTYHKLVIIIYVIKFLRIATRRDIEFLIRSITGNQPESEQISQLLLILLGCQVLKETECDDNDFFSLNGNPSSFYSYSEGNADEVAELADEIFQLIDADEAYSNALERSDVSA
jgi:hypothetical protein